MKNVKLKIGTESQFQDKLKDLPIGTLVGTTDPISEGDLSTDIINSLAKANNALPKPTNENTGSVGQVLKKTASGSEWGDVTIYHHYVKLTCNTGTVYYDFISNTNVEYTTDTFPAMDNTTMTTLTVLKNGLYSTVSGSLYRVDGALKVDAHGIYATSADAFGYLSITGEAATVIEDIVK